MFDTKKFEKFTGIALRGEARVREREDGLLEVVAPIGVGLRNSWKTLEAVRRLQGPAKAATAALAETGWGWDLVLLVNKNSTWGQRLLAPGEPDPEPEPEKVVRRKRTTKKKAE